MSPSLDRRELLKSVLLAPGLCAGGVGLRWLPEGDSRALVVLELEGGNDGLATLVPTDDPALAKARRTLADVRKGALPLAPGFGLHPALPGVHALAKEGSATFVHGVGYPKPDRSHFRSRDIWQSGDPELVKVVAGTTGWLGRAADWLAQQGAALPALAIGSLAVPLALRGRRVVVPSLERLEDYELQVDGSAGRGEARRRALAALTDARADELAHERPGTQESFLAEVGKTALRGAETLRTALRGYTPRAEYPDTALGRRLNLVARFLVAGFGTRLFHLSLSGFDTHARELPAQEALLRILDRALAAFVQDLRGHGVFDRVTLLVHSEFGRRVAENASLGTDHGAAGPALVVGPELRGPLLGAAPSLTDLDDGDLKAGVDFRAIYAALLQRLSVPPAEVLGSAVAPFALSGRRA